MSETLTIDFSRPMPLFPLPQCVLLPYATIPLHIFEPRYRAMIGDVLDSNGIIAMASFQGEDWKADYEGSPQIHEYVCVGYIVRHDRQPNGRYHILLQGICRARIKKELPSEVYRRALLEPTEPTPPMEIDLAEHREKIETLLADPLLKTLSSISAVHRWLNPEVPTAALIDLATLTICENPGQRYESLSEPNIIVRARWLEKMLRNTQRTMATAERFNPGEQAGRRQFELNPPSPFRPS